MKAAHVSVLDDVDKDKHEACIRKRITNVLRMLVIALVLGYICFQDYADKCLQDMWSVLRENALFKWDTCEPFFVFWTFKFVFLVYDLFEALYPNSHYWLIPEARGVHKRHGRSWLQCIYHISAESYLQFAYYYAPILVFDFFYPRRKLPQSIPSVGVVVLQVAGMLATYDFCFFWCHLLMHRNRTLYRQFHQKHHLAGSKYPMNHWHTILLSFGQQWTNVTCSIFTVNSLKFATLGAYRYHPLARLIYNIVTVTWLSEEHSAYDMPWMIHNLIPLQFFGGPIHHYAHHTRGHGNYQKWFTYLDSWCGTKLPAFEETTSRPFPVETAQRKSPEVSSRSSSPSDKRPNKSERVAGA
uniref:Fatty acid hydroxylase domain-containing protein n=1 Tax=Lotharella globosa TaxID=91324 RepID=A0A7S4E0H4_9EUKA|mmetsp:Transcript_19496/g.39440  ORF Transcript_19496/g.39440 Transcript_19496/m.39440 type:complete len:355 (+) Transcript_19496:39-1103(+)|eukprot:CAMPEP_0167781448 /NCGR_PEP_ID=MMETSP0111_2-20121227/5937_1 /TAXON_ID=91324 /ORGANISM="Lotharella globosa, Strain CCCM811" /LENGTH=354 /DNA_ID=CAMNT_0007672109 /DNA_START=39 /DNA_END=1103 /DNA_ORIENTATION=+